MELPGEAGNIQDNCVRQERVGLDRNPDTANKKIPGTSARSGAKDSLQRLGIHSRSQGLMSMVAGEAPLTWQS